MYLVNLPSGERRFLNTRAIYSEVWARIYNDKADSYPQHVSKFFNFRIFIEFFIHEVNKTFKFWESGPYLYNKYQ